MVLTHEYRYGKSCAAGRESFCELGLEFARDFLKGIYRRWMNSLQGALGVVGCLL